VGRGGPLVGGEEVVVEGGGGGGEGMGRGEVELFALVGKVGGGFGGGEGVPWGGWLVWNDDCCWEKVGGGGVVVRVTLMGLERTD